MRVNGTWWRTVWPAAPGRVEVIDQRHLPWAWVVEGLESVDAVATAIRDMHVRGAGLIGATAAWGMALAAREDASDAGLSRAGERLKATRPTAVNLAWAVDRVRRAVEPAPDRAAAAWAEAQRIADEDAAMCEALGRHGLDLLRAIAARKADGVVQVLTHCNAGWLAFVDHGSATAPIYAAHDAGVRVHVWVDETRPRNQGASLTAWELGQHGVPHTVIVDNAGGHLMQHGRVDVVITGADRVTRAGDAANKVGTYLKALAARDNGVPFYVALPSSTFDGSLTDGVAGIPIEERDASEVTHVTGWDGAAPRAVRVVPEGSAVANPSFDVTPARLITGLITERGVCPATEAGILALHPELGVTGGGAGGRTGGRR